MKDLKEIFQKNDWTKHGSRTGFGSGPNGDWKIILVTTLLLAILISGWNLYMFLGINNERVEVEDQNEEGLDLNKLKSTIEYYQAKEVEFEKIKGGIFPTISDPSI